MCSKSLNSAKSTNHVITFFSITAFVLIFFAFDRGDCGERVAGFFFGQGHHMSFLYLEISQKEDFFDIF
jgi:hypothetical protein